MATRRTASKTSRKATINFDWNQGSNKKKGKNSSKKIKKIGFATIMLAVFVFALSSVGGFFALKLVTKNDCFEIVGNDEITLEIGAENYTDEGVKVIAFGKDVSDDVTIETNLKKAEDGTYSAEEEGTYYIIYKSNNFKYNSLFKVQKIRLITFVDPTEPGELQQGNGGVNE